MPQSSKFFGVCISIIGAGLPMLINQAVCFEALRKIGTILFTNIVAAFKKHRRKQQAEEFVKVYELTRSVVSYEEDVRKLLSLLGESYRWKFSLIYIDSITRVVMCLSNREKDPKRDELMALACCGDVSAQLPGIFTYFRPDKDKKIIIRAKNIYRYNYPKIMQKVCESIFILFHSEAAPKEEYSRVLNSLLNAFENNPISERIASQAHALVHDFGVMYSSFNKADNFADQGFKDKEARPVSILQELVPEQPPKP